MLTIEISKNILLVPRILILILLLTQILCNLPHRPRKERHPTHQIHMQLTHARWARPRIIIQTTGKHMFLGTASPPVRLDPRGWLSAPFFELASLSTAEPVVVPPQGGVNGQQVLPCVRGRGQISGCSRSGASWKVLLTSQTELGLERRG